MAGIERKKTEVKDLGGAGDVGDWILGRTEASSENSVDARARLMEELSSETDKKNRDGIKGYERNPFKNSDLDDLPRLVTGSSKEKIRERTRNDIFGNMETQKWYINQVREALKNLNGDRLHRFIEDHQEYKRSAHTIWNAQLADLLGISVEDKYKGKTELKTYKRITAAVQLTLIDLHKNDVFQITKKEHGEWINVDAKCGPYVIANLNEYWEAVFSPKSSLQKPSYPHLNHKYGQTSKNNLDRDYRYLGRQIKDSPLGPNPFEENEGENVDTAEILAEEIQ